jgi:hypothetical protein
MKASHFRAGRRSVRAQVLLHVLNYSLRAADGR